MERKNIFKLLEKKIRDINLSHPARVAIDGVDGSGKTVFADDLADHLKRTKRQIIRASIDKFHNAKQVRYQKGEYSPEGYYFGSFDNRALIDNLLEPLGSNGPMEYRKGIFDYMSDKESDSSPEKAQKDSILIFDGIFLFRPELFSFWDLKIFLDVPFEITLERVRKRTKDKKYLGTDSNITDKYEKRYIPGQKLYFKNANPKEKADIAINNSDFDDPVVERMPSQELA